MYSQYGVNQTRSTVGGLAVAVPGEIRGMSTPVHPLILGWEALHERHGSLPWPRLFAPAIKLARHGFPVSQDLATYLTNQTFMLNDTNWSEAYAPNGTLLGMGDIVYRKKFAIALEKIANEGAGAFYNGSIAANTIKKITQTGGIMTLNDLANYTVLVKNASSIGYR